MSNLDLLGIPNDLGQGGAYLDGTDPNRGLKALLRGLGGRIHVAVADETALAAIAAKDRTDKMLVLVMSGPALWYRDDSSSASATPGSVVTSTDSTTGRWLVGPQSAGNVRVATPVADAAAIQGIAAGSRYDGEIVVKLDDYTVWTFASGSSASASDWVIVPSSGTGRWLRNHVTLSDTASPADLTALKAIAAASRYDGLVKTLKIDGSKWRFVAASSLTGDDILVATPAAGSGRWFRADASVDITVAVTSATADATALYTVPTGWVLEVGVPFWKVGTTFTTSTSGAAGLSSSNSGLATKGDLLGGASGDLVATLVSTGAYAKGTKGTKVGTPAAVIVGGETIRYDQIAGSFTAGAATAHVPVQVLVVPAS